MQNEINKFVAPVRKPITKEVSKKLLEFQEQSKLRERELLAEMRGDSYRFAKKRARYY